jgi:hypothetical protein
MPANYVTVSGKDISDLVDQIEDVVDGHPSMNVAISCFVVAILSQNPEVDPETLQTCVKGLSEYVSASLFNESASGSVN